MCHPMGHLYFRRYNNKSQYLLTIKATHLSVLNMCRPCAAVTVSVSIGVLTLLYLEDTTSRATIFLPTLYQYKEVIQSATLRQDSIN